MARDAEAHAVGLSRGDYRITGHTVTAQLVFARSESEALDADTLMRGVVVRMGSRACQASVLSSEWVEPDGVAKTMRFVCGAGSGDALSVELPLLDELAQGHRHVVRLQAGASTVDDVLYRGHAETSMGLRGTAEAIENLSQAPARSPLSSMVRMGVEHILTGYDHLLFLFGLVLVGGRARSLLKVVTAFTLAHSVTLGVAALGLWTPSPALVEPAIALSIAYVGVENFFVKDAGKRWRVTMPFGLVHGFGFASALRGIALPHDQVPLALLSFNIGVELGQLMVLSLMLPLLVLAARTVRGWGGTGVRALSAATAALGAVWFVLRIVSAWA
jgi:hypothetical protein